ncbi:MAG: aminodeoxychorismate lyase [Xanthomonadaceae bacterium]|nr:aminodeoxychorismate lyase [Xanthomonadaceae bacterium]MDE2244843.1 aminodeoxychorismate lyase [Xanthomonadaceae bacterium]
MNARVLVDGAADGSVPVLDRGLLYGDGLFETVLYVDGRAPLWSRHMMRLAVGCERLALPLPDPALLAAEAARVIDARGRAVLRITLTRGMGARGYAPPERVQATRIVAAFAAPGIAAHWYAAGIRLRFCDTRLALQPRLAGIKHLNRLEQVLARAEWNDPAIAEGLMLDTEGRVIAATAANLFAVIDGRLCTPRLDRCGVAGVARAEVMAQLPTAERDLDPAVLVRSSEIFLTSAVRGVLPVTTLAERAFAVGPVTRALQAHWRTLGLLPEGMA